MLYVSLGVPRVPIVLVVGRPGQIGRCIRYQSGTTESLGGRRGFAAEARCVSRYHSALDARRARATAGAPYRGTSVIPRITNGSTVLGGEPSGLVPTDPISTSRDHADVVTPGTRGSEPDWRAGAILPRYVSAERRGCAAYISRSRRR